MTDLLNPPQPDTPTIALEADPDVPRRQPPAPFDEETWEFFGRLLTWLVVGGLMLFTFLQMRPLQIFANTTPAGGDMGAHVWGPAYLRDHILPHGRLSGWAPDWYGGFPMYQFYMVIPALMVVLVDVILPYGIALKLVSVLGIVTLPLFCWLFGRLNGMPKPMPEVLSCAAVWFLFDDTFKIYGGNIASTMAGEFSFSISLSFAMAFFAVFSATLRTGKYRALAASLAALAALSHGIVLFFVAIGAVMLFLVHAGIGRFKILMQVGIVSALMAMFWLIPFKLGGAYQTDMFYERRPTGKTPDDRRTDTYWEMFFPQSTFWDRTIGALALIAFVDALRRRNRAGAFLGIMTVIYGAWAAAWPQSILWNARLLPFMYLTRYMLAALGIVTVVRWIARFVSPLESNTTGRTVRTLMIGMAALLAAGTCVHQSFHMWRLPLGAQRYDQTAKKWIFEWPAWSGPRFVGADTDKGFVSGWADWNYRGYEKKAAYGEYEGLMSTMKAIGQDPVHGCGRALWENNNDQDKYGTPMAQMLLPFWTDGCIASMEGLFFEASGTTPYHFLAASAMSEHSSNPVRRLRYEDGDLDKGVEYLKTLGVRYYIAYRPAMIAKAAKHQDLKEIATSGVWHVYQIDSGNERVVPLTTEPLVVASKQPLAAGEAVEKDLGSSRDRWLEVGASWFQHQSEWAGLPVASGPEAWQRVDLKVTSEKDTDDRTLAVVAPIDRPKAKPLEPVKVSNIISGDDSVSFDVDRVGVPVLVRVSAFPNWKVQGATGPYRAAPNFMVVVPTSEHVRLHYGYTPMDLVAWLLTFVGLAGLLYLWRSGQMPLPALDDDLALPSPPDPDDRLDAEVDNLLVRREQVVQAGSEATATREADAWAAPAGPPGNSFYDWERPLSEPSSSITIDPVENVDLPPPDVSGGHHV